MRHRSLALLGAFVLLPAGLTAQKTASRAKDAAKPAQLPLKYKAEANIGRDQCD